MGVVLAGRRQLDLDFESMPLASDPGLRLNVYSAAAGTPTADWLKLLASWAAARPDDASESAPPGSFRRPPTT